MRIWYVNGGVVFYPANEEEAGAIQKTPHNAKLVDNGGFVPKSLLKYYNGWVDDDNYSHYFDYLGQVKRQYYNIDKGILQPNPQLNDGCYYIPSFKNGNLITGSYVAFNKYEKAEILNLPLHIELVKLADSYAEMSQYVRDLEKLVSDFFKNYQQDKVKNDAAITNIAIAIKTFPAVAGSPINPSLIATTQDTTSSIANNFKTEYDKYNEYVDSTTNFIDELIEVVKSK